MVVVGTDSAKDVTKWTAERLFCEEVGKKNKTMGIFVLSTLITGALIKLCTEFRYHKLCKLASLSTDKLII